MKLKSRITVLVNLSIMSISTSNDSFSLTTKSPFCIQVNFGLVENVSLPIMVIDSKVILNWKNTQIIFDN